MTSPRAKPAHLGPKPDGSPMRLQFRGATDTVTGSRYLLENGGSRLLVAIHLVAEPLPRQQRQVAAVVDVDVGQHHRVDRGGGHR